MKKIILIIIGILIILLIIGVWGYLFMYGTPKNSEEVFAKLGFSGGNTELTPTVVPESTTVDVGGTESPSAPNKLKQLTTRPVAGATFTGTGILYVEQGTGHLYHINLTSGTETLVSGTTIPKAREAVFSDGGAYVAITTTDGDTPKTIVGSVSLEGGSGSLEGVSLPTGATQVHFDSATGTLFYLLKEADGSSGYSYSIAKGTGTQIFSIPLRDVHVLWGDNIYVYTTPTVHQTGYVYKVENNYLTYVTKGGLGLTGLLYTDGIIITHNESGVISSYALTPVGTVTLPLRLIPEKCTSGEEYLYCASPYTIESGELFPDNWYKGVLTLSDDLWSINPSSGEATLLSNFLSESGREIDVSQIGTDTAGDLIYFINKNDNTLWVFDATL